MASLLSVENLQVQFQTKKGINTAVDGVSFSVEKGRILGIVGESGCGKSVTSMSILQLLGSNARISGGSIKLDGKELIGLPEKEMCRIRGNDIAMIFQDPMTALNPTLTIGTQLMEPIMLHQNCGKKEAWTRAVDVLKRVGIAAPEKRMKEYPHQLSGGMRQRVMIAMAVSCEPRLLIADEPTTALDVTIQAQILERGTAKEIFYESKHPYTWALLSSVPKKGDASKEELYALKGTPPDLILPLNECPFASRCEYCMEICKEQNPMETSLSDTHKVSCWLMYPKAPKVKSFYDREER